MWGPQLDALADEFTVIAWDAPGCGGSFDPPPDFGSEGYADSLARFIGEQSLERPHVLGLSFGTIVALELFRRHPGIPGSLVLASAYAGWAGSLPAEEVEARRRGWIEDANRPPEQMVDALADTLFTDSVPAAVRDELMGMTFDFRPAGLRAVANASAGADLRDVLARIDVPTLLIYGDADKRSPVSPVGKNLHAAIPGSELVVLPGIGHMVNLEVPERFNEEVRSFLRA
jgi:pimeloyl-ACP methyl ester carboxylesterase